MVHHSAVTYFLGDYDPDLRVRPMEGYRATNIKLFSCLRPHMRGFHFAWLSFFVAFLGWFALAPLLPVVQRDLGLSRDDVWLSNIAAVGSTILARWVVGPLCDRYGPKRVQFWVLLWGGVFSFFAPLVSDATGLIVIRFFIGVLGASFVCTEFWTTLLFAKETVGTAQALTAGWGALGGAASHFFVAVIYTNLRDDGYTIGQAWRIAICFPAMILVLAALVVYCGSDDTPQGDYSTLQRSRAMEKPSVFVSARKAFADPAVWVLAVQYGASLGVELTVNNAMTTYFVDHFDQGLVVAASITGLFGLMNLFARALGGLVSDKASARWGLRGRLVVQLVCLLLEGVMLMAFASMTDVNAAIALLVIFSIFVQMSEGATFAIVPYVNPPCTGAVVGVVSAGGNIGAVFCGLFFLLGNMSMAATFRTIGAVVMVISLLTPLIFISGDYPGLCCNPMRMKAKRKTQLDYKVEADLTTYF